MRILLLTQYYPPETGAAQNRLADVAARLQQRGHSVTVLTALPNYPRGEIFEPYRGKLVREANESGIRIVRTWCYATLSKAFAKRIANYLSFAAISVIVGLFKIKRQDVVIVESPPLFLGLAGLALSRLKRGRLVMNISDLWPASVAALGVMREGFLLRMATRLEEYLYSKSDLVTGQTEGIVGDIRRRFPDKPVVFLPNGVSPEQLLDQSRRSEMGDTLRRELGLQDKFLVGYTGLHGIAQGLDTLLESARLLGRNRNVVFVFFGDGPEKERLVGIANQVGLDNVRFYPSRSAADMPRVFAALDVAIVPLKRHPLFRGALPSKLFETMGAGLPVVLSAEGEAQRVVEKSCGGICVPPEDPLMLADAVLRLESDAALRRSLGENGRRYVIGHFNRSEIAQRLDRALTFAVTKVGFSPQQEENTEMQSVRQHK